MSLKTTDHLILHAQTFLMEDKLKEWSCHVQFVRDIAMQLQQKYGGDALVIEVAAILHDVGRGRELDGEHHSLAGMREAKVFLDGYALDEQQKLLILQCIKNHGAEEPPQTLEEKIIISADSASKIVYHTCFMLMCKKENTVSRARRGLKYLRKGWNKIQFPDYQITLQKIYLRYQDDYEQVLTAW